MQMKILFELLLCLLAIRGLMNVLRFVDKESFISNAVNIGFDQFGLVR
jgi:hypothetical protein